MNAQVVADRLFAVCATGEVAERFNRMIGYQLKATGYFGLFASSGRQLLMSKRIFRSRDVAEQHIPA